MRKVPDSSQLARSGRRGAMRIALVGAGQTSWQTRQPVHFSGTTIGMPSVTSIAPLSGQRSEHIVQ